MSNSSGAVPRAENRHVLRRPELGTRIAVVAVLAGLAVAYYLGWKGSGELAVAVDGVRRHEVAINDHGKRLDAHDGAIAAQGARLDAHDGALKAQTAAIAAAREAADAARKQTTELDAEVKKLRAELGELKAGMDARDRATRKMLERLDRLERTIAGQTAAD